MADRLSWQGSDTIGLISKALGTGRLVAGTSDTVIGLLAAPTIEGAQKLNKIKGRQNKPYIILLDTFEQAQKYVDHNQLLQIKNIAKVCWPGPVTLIVHALSQLPIGIRSAEGTIAIRIPEHRYLRELARNMGGVFSTSANLSGKQVPNSVEELEPEILNKVMYVVDEYAQLNQKSEVQASTIIDCTQDPWVVIREGLFPVSKLRTIAGVRIETNK